MSFALPSPGHQPTSPEGGATQVLALTAKPLGRDSISLPVVRETVRGPVAAARSILSTTVALMEEFTVREATVIPAPKSAVVVPCTQLVRRPCRPTVRFCAPGGPVAGVTEIITPLATMTSIAA